MPVTRSRSHGHVRSAAMASAEREPIMSTREELDAWRSLTVSATLERAYGADEARRLFALREAALEGMHHERFVPQPLLSFDD